MSASDFYHHPWFNAYITDIGPEKEGRAAAHPRHGRPRVIAAIMVSGSVDRIVDRASGDSVGEEAWIAGSTGRDSLFRDSPPADHTLTAGPGGVRFLCVCRKDETDFAVDVYDDHSEFTLAAGEVAVVGDGHSRCGDDENDGLHCYGPFEDDRALVAEGHVLLVSKPR